MIDYKFPGEANEDIQNSRENALLYAMIKDNSILAIF